MSKIKGLRVKTFSGYEEEIENWINEFFYEGGIELIDIKYQLSANNEGFIHSALVIYRDLDLL